MTRLLLFFGWLMLNGSASPGNLLIAAALALGLPWLVGRSLTPLRPTRALWRLVGVVLYDIAVSNVEVARRVLGPEAAIQPRFVWVPLTLQTPQGVVALASIITLTPGTVSAEVSADRRHLLVHALHCPDEPSAAALVETIKSRYEAPLKEVFG